MNISAINDTLLPVVLFVIYFVFVSVVQYNLKDKANVSTNQEVSKTSEEKLRSFTYKDAFSAEFDPDPFSERAVEIVASVELESVEKVEAPISPETIHQSIPEIIDSLGKRDIRKLCAPLGIKQKTNGTELTTELMKALVKRKFKENPLQVIEIMKERFPQFLSAFPESDRQQQVEREAC